MSDIHRYITALAEQASRTPEVPVAPIHDGAIDFDPAKNRVLFDLDLMANGGTITPEDIRAFGVMLHRNKDKTIRLYHGTSSLHPVMDQGLLPTSAKRRLSLQSGAGFVYLAYDPNRALRFAEMGYSYPRRPLTVYEVVVPLRDVKPDTDQLKNKRMWGDFPNLGSSLAESLIYGGGVRYKGTIHPAQIAVHSQYDETRQRIGATVPT